MKRIALWIVLLFGFGCAWAQGTPDDSLVFGVTSAPRTFNPWITNDSASWTAMDMMYSGLTRLDASGQPVGDLAETWEVSEDGLSYTFHLRDNATWHDGAPVTAADVVFTFQALLDDAAHSVWASRFLQIEGAEAFHEGQSDELAGVEAIDSHTVKFTLVDPLAPFLGYLSVQTPIMPKHLLGELDPSEYEQAAFFQHPVGSGPFKFVRYQSGQFVEYASFEQYHLGRPGYARLFLRIGSADTLLAQLQRGEVDVAPVSPVEAERVKSMPGVTLLQYPTSIVQAININLAKPYLQDIRVRQAIAHAIDKQMLVQIVLGSYGKVANSPLMAPDWVTTDKLTRYPYDPEKARQLLQEAGWDSDTRLALRYPTGNKAREAAATVIQQALRAVGINAELQISDFATLTSDAVAGNFDLLLLGNQTLADPDYIASQYTSTTIPPAGVNYMRYHNDRVDALLAQGRTTTKLEARYPLYEEFQQIVTKELPKVFLYVDPEIYGVSTQVKGVEPANGVGLLRSLYWNIHTWAPAGN